MVVKYSVLSKISFCTISLCLLAACQKPVEDDSPSGSSSSSSGGPVQTTNGEATTDCGIVMGGKTHNPVSYEDGETIHIEKIISNNLISIKGVGPDAGGERLVKLQGIASGPEDRVKAAMNTLRQLSSGSPTFFQASKDCAVTLDGGGQGTIGQIVTRDGRSFSEELVKAGLSDIDPADACGGDQIAGCLSALKGTDVKPKGEMGKFLWKPKSDTKGNIVVIHEVHCGAKAVVNGEVFTDKGSGNGRCGTYAGRKHGCAYGSNIKVEIIDEATGRPYMHNNLPYYIVKNGCQRDEFQ